MNKEKPLEIENLAIPENKTEYQRKIREELQARSNPEEESNPQDRLKKITDICINLTEETVGRRQSQRKSNNLTIKELSKKQKKIRCDIEATRNKAKREELRIDRNKTTNSLHQMLQREKEEQMEKKVENLEKLKDDSRKMFAVIRDLKPEKKKNVVVETPEGITSSTCKKLEEISKHFKTLFHKENEEDIEEIAPIDMTNPFTAGEVRKAISKLKDNKSPGIDNICAEMLKSAPSEIDEEIAKLMNDMAATGSAPKEITLGILVPLPKPGKKPGPPSNFRPIILLSMLRKILAICLLERCIGRFLTEIPTTQAAYQSGRSTTEHVLACKLLAERAISSADEETTILLLDMSRAFDTVKRKNLIQMLKQVLDQDELHLVKLLVKDVTLQVRCDNKLGEAINTNVGVPQGDCLSPIFFIIYLANALKQVSEENEPTKRNKDEEKRKKDDHCYSKPITPKVIDQQYADDVSWIAINSNQEVEYIKEEIPAKLMKLNLKVNEDKTEEIRISRTGGKDWKEVKYLGSLLGTEEDFKRRKQMATVSYNKLRHIIESRKTSTNLKMRLFETYIASIFLYNSEVWTLTKTMEAKIDAFQRKLIRRMFKIYWEDRVSNEELHRRFKFRKWSETIKERRMRWYGHMLRLPENAPVKLALTEAERKVKKPRGGQVKTWIAQMKEDLNKVNIPYQAKEFYAADRALWRAKINSCRM